MEIPRDWINVSGATSDMRLCQVSFQESAGCPPLVVTRSLVVKEDRSWQVHVYSHPIDLKFCLLFDKFFDCLNTRRAGEGKEKRKPDLDPYRSDKDVRLHVSSREKSK